MAEISLDLAHTGDLAPAAAKPATAAGSWQLRVVIMWALLAIVLLMVNAQAIMVERFGDPDDALRLVEVRDLIAGQSWFDVHQYRIAAPAGVPMHWSRLVDIPLAIGILALRPLLGQPLAELVTVVMVPLLTLLAALMLVGRLAARFFDTETVGIACLVTGIAGPLLFQLTPLRIDHHGWQVVLALAALNGLAARDPIRGGLVIGAALAALLAISIEGLPITAVFLGVLALRGLIALSRTAAAPMPSGAVVPTGHAFAGLAAGCATLAGSSLLIFVGTCGLGDLATPLLTTHCDQVSPVHLALFAAAALGSGALVMMAPRRWPIALAMIGALGAGVLGLYLVAAPQCRGGAFVALDPLVLHFWYEGVAEGMPFWHLPLAFATESVGVPLCGLIATAILWRDAPCQRTRDWWRDHALMLAGAALIGCILARATATACGFAAVPTAAIVLRWIVALRTTTPVRRIAGYLALMMVLMPPLPVVAWARISARLATMQTGHRSGPTDLATGTSRCDYRQAARGLDLLPATDIFAPLDIGPDLLVRSHQRVVATGHHRGAAAMHDVIAAFLGTPDAAHTLIVRRHATLVAICPDIAEPGLYIHAAPHGFMAQLLHGPAPAWLQPVDLAPGSHLEFWRVVS